MPKTRCKEWFYESDWLDDFKNQARSKLRQAVKKGIIVRKRCGKCGGERVEGHHEDYSKPLEVMWFCRDCHIDRHHEVII